MDLTNASPQDIGSALTRAGVTWTYDDDGDVRLRFRSTEPPWTDVVFYEFDRVKGDWSMRGQFLNGRAVPHSNGATQWEVSLVGDMQPTAVAQKVVTVYLMPGSGGVDLQVHASIAPLDQPRPMHIKLIPGSLQVDRIVSSFPRYTPAGDEKQFWMWGGATGTGIDERDFIDLIREASQVGLKMFDGPFTGWMYASDV